MDYNDDYDDKDNEDDDDDDDKISNPSLWSERGSSDDAAGNLWTSAQGCETNISARNYDDDDDDEEDGHHSHDDDEGNHDHGGDDDDGICPRL